LRSKSVLTSCFFTPKKSKLKSTFFLLVFLLIGCVQPTFATEPNEEGGHDEDPVEAMMHHIADANEFHLFGDYSIPLPCIAWSEDGFLFTLSSTFEHGHKAYKGYVLYHGVLMKVKDNSFPKKTVEISAGHGHDEEATNHHDDHDHHAHEHDDDQTVSGEGIEGEGETEDDAAAKTIMYNGKEYELEACMSLQNTDSSWYDFSITKNVFAMFLGLVLLLILFSSVSAAYNKREKQAPKGLQSFMEPLILFIRDDVVRPAVGEKDWKRFFPFIMSLFFFILIINLLGLIPFFPGSANVTGNIGVTMVLAVFVFIVVNINGKKDYWMHILWMPGVPTAIKPLLAIIEIMGLFIKPATLFIRLFANITAGHIIILSLVSLIFFFSQAGGVGGGIAGIALAVPFVFALNMLELFVAFLQAFVFALLAALYIGAAVEEHHHEEAH